MAIVSVEVLEHFSWASVCVWPASSLGIFFELDGLDVVLRLFF